MITRDGRSSGAGVCALLAVVALGCGEDGPVGLAELDEPTLGVRWYHAALGQPLDSPHFWVQITPRQGPRDHEDECPELVPQTVVTVGDEALSVVSLGGWQTLEGRLHCTVPTYSLPGERVLAHPVEATTVIEAFDGDSTFRAVARGLFVERGATLEPSATDQPGQPRQLEVGQRATLAWTPPSDELGLVAVYFDPGPPPQDGPVPPLATLSGADLEIDGHRVGLSVPDAAVGAGVLRVEASAAVPTEACRGFARCDVEVLGASARIDVRVR
jgi:hypothetical protein